MSNSAFDANSALDNVSLAGSGVADAVALDLNRTQHQEDEFK